MKKCLSMVLTLIMLLCIIPTTTVFASTVEWAEIKNIDLPVVGSKPDLSAELGNLSDEMKITKVEWTEYDADWEWQKDMTANDTFKEGYWYVVFVYLETASGNTFGSSVIGIINNETAKISGNSVQANGTKVCFYTSYQATKALTAIGKVDLTVVKPVVGKTPTFAKVDTTQYFSEKYGTVSNCSNGVTWTNQSSGVNITVSNPFKEGTKYKVTYYLTAKDGYKFTASTACTINGTAAAIDLTDHYHAKVSLSNLVPGDGKKEITSLDLSVTSPKDGEKPTYTKIDGAGYYSDNGLNGIGTKIYENGIAWYKSATSYISPGTTETFKGGSEYTVKIALTPKDGYKFGKSLTAKINGKTATVETFDDGSINVSVKLTATKKDHTHTAGSDWQYNDTEHWKVCSDKTCGALVGEKQKHSNSDSDGKCDICGYKLPIKVPEETTTSGGATSNATSSTTKPSDSETTGTPSTGDATKPTDGTTDATDSTTESNNSETTVISTTDDGSNQNDNEKNGNSILIWVLISVVVLIVIGIVLIVIVLKKKSTGNDND